MTTTFAPTLIQWYEINKRDLPWRETQDPYIIWLSEIILQQTRVKQGLPYFERFLERFPTIHDFAQASEEEVLKLWQGLGYYSRARNMRACAAQIVEEYDGKFPSNYESLLKLKGVGKYTAAAIASFSFQQAIPVLDGNVYRVLSRVFGIDADIGEAKNQPLFWDKALSLIDPRKPDTFNQAIMEFGALHCTPKSPACEECPFQNSCFAYANNLQQALPVKAKKTKVKKRYFNYLIVRHGDQVLMKPRQEKDIWQGMYDFLLFESGSPTPVENLMNKEARFLADKGVLTTCSENYKHVLSHQVIFAQFVAFSMRTITDFKSVQTKYGMEAVKIDEMERKPISRLLDKYLKKETEYLT